MTKLMQDTTSFCAHEGADPPETKDGIVVVAADVTGAIWHASTGGWKSDWANRKDPAFW